MRESTSRPVGGITVAETADATVAYLWGEIDEALREEASSALTRALDRNLPVVLDTGRVEFIDSAGIAFLIQLCTIGREEGRPMLTAPPRHSSGYLVSSRENWSVSQRWQSPTRWRSGRRGCCRP